MTDRNDDDNQGSNSDQPKPPYMREERFDTESPDRLLDSRPAQRPLNEQKPATQKPQRKLLNS